MTTGRTHGTRLLFSLLAMLVLAGMAAGATVPTEPMRLTGDLLYTPGGGKHVHLIWFHMADSTGEDVDGFNIYQAIENNGSYTFTQIESVTKTPGNFQFGADIPATTEDMYRYYVTAYNNDGESAPSNTIDIDVFFGTVTFTSPAGGTRDLITEGHAYTRDFDAESSSGATVRYALIDQFPGMTIDAATGVVSWTAEMLYWSNTYTVQAYQENDPRISATMQVFVEVEADPALYCGIIHGTVNDQNGDPVTAASWVTAYPAAPDSLQAPQQGTVSNGFYTIKVKPGTYHLVFSSRGEFRIEWYQDVYDRSQATPVVATCGDSVIANFSVERYPTNPNPIDSVVGTVRTEDGLAAEADIYVYLVHAGSDSLLSVTRTSQYGHYAIMVPAGASYVMRAEPVTDALLDQWYNLASDRTGAMALTGTHIGVDFALERAFHYSNEISGTLVDHDRNPLTGSLTAYMLVDENGRTELRAIRTIYVRLGDFSFTDLEPGTYVIFGAPLDSNSMAAPGYYKHGNAARTWDKADRLTIDGDDVVANLEFRLRRVKKGNGSNRLRGVISGNSGSTKRSDRSMLGTMPLADAVVYAIDDNDEINGSAITDTEGRFTIEGLGTGTFTVLVDKVGFASSQSMVTFTSEGDEQAVEPALEPSESVSSAPLAPATAGAAASVYPNPSRGTVTVRFGAEAGTAYLSLTDAAGTQVLARTVRTDGGENSINIETAGLNSGVYFLTLRQGASVISMPVSIVR